MREISTCRLRRSLGFITTLRRGHVYPRERLLRYRRV